MSALMLIKNDNVVLIVVLVALLAAQGGNLLGFS